MEEGPGIELGPSFRCPIFPYASMLVSSRLQELNRRRNVTDFGVTEVLAMQIIYKIAFVLLLLEARKRVT